MQTWWRIALVAATLVPSTLCDCESYGLDFQNGGTYFQNSQSADPFTALQEFEGCQNDTAQNVLLDPQGDQSQCSATPLTPDDTPETVTCEQWPKDKLYSGDWSLLIISNNGDAEPIAFQRDFSLTVGPQQTITLAQSTITGGSAGTTTQTPTPVTTTVTSGFVQFTQTTISTTTSTTTTVVPASCAVVTRRASKDPIATVVPSILGELDAIASSVIAGNNAKRAEPTQRFKKAIARGDIPEPADKGAFVRARRDSLARIAKRAPDNPTVTSTPTPAYVPATVTASGRTSSRTFYVPFLITTQTSTRSITSTETITTTSSGAAASCSKSGGILI